MCSVFLHERVKSCLSATLLAIISNGGIIIIFRSGNRKTNKIVFYNDKTRLCNSKTNKLVLGNCWKVGESGERKRGSSMMTNIEFKVKDQE